MNLNVHEQFRVTDIQTLGPVKRFCSGSSSEPFFYQLEDGSRIDPSFFDELLKAGYIAAIDDGEKVLGFPARYLAIKDSQGKRI